MVIDANSQEENPIIEQAEILDHGLTLALTPGLFNKVYRLASESSTVLEVIGKFTGAVTLVNNGRKTIDAWNKGDRKGAIVNGLLTIGQGGAMFFGEEIELGWNAGTFLLDLYKKK